MKISHLSFVIIALGRPLDISDIFIQKKKKNCSKLIHTQANFRFLRIATLAKKKKN